jgi:nucleoid-associated protein YgaU
MKQLFCKKVLYLALFMVVAVGVQSAADTALEEARATLTAAETAYADAEASLTAAKAGLSNSQAAVAEAEAAFARAETALTEAKVALAAAEAPADTPAPAGAETSDVSDAGSTDTPSPAVADGGSADTVVSDDAAASTAPEKIPVVTEREVPDSIRRNEYFLESERFLALAQEAYNAGDYDTATEYAEEAARLARLSDEYIAQQTGWNGVLPATYTVREWDAHGDCFWNIAGQPWAYNDPYRWRVLYEANRAKLPDPNNPNLVEPGTVLDIPSIKGETRQGEWVSGRTYEPLR